MLPLAVIVPQPRGGIVGGSGEGGARHYEGAPIGVQLCQGSSKPKMKMREQNGKLQAVSNLI